MYRSLLDSMVIVTRHSDTSIARMISVGKLVMFSPTNLSEVQNVGRNIQHSQVANINMKVCVYALISWPTHPSFSLWLILFK